MRRTSWALMILAVAAVGAGGLAGARILGRAPTAALQLQAVDTHLVRTDYSDPAAWAEVRALVSRPTPEGFVARVDLIEDRAWADLQPAEVISRLYPDRKGQALMILADARTMHDPEHTLLCVDLHTLNSLRVVPALLWSIENNLSLANLDWRDFAENADKDGVLRSFKTQGEDGRPLIPAAVRTSGLTGTSPPPQG